MSDYGGGDYGGITSGGGYYGGDFGLPDLGNITGDFTFKRQPTTAGKGADVYIPVVYGRREVDGIVIAPPFKVTVDNTGWITLKIILCEGEIEEIETIFINDIDSTNSQFNGVVFIESNTGTDGQAALVDSGDYVIPEWTSDHKLSGFASVSIRMKRSSDLFKSYPKLRFLVKGKKCYDPRSGLTEYTANPILHELDYITNTRYGKGKTISDYTAWTQAANYCDTMITEYVGGGQIKRYENNIVLNTADPVKDNALVILTSCDGRVIESNGTLKAYVEQAGASVFALNSDVFNGGLGIKLGAKKDRLNKVKVNYIDPTTWSGELQVYQSDTLKAADNGIELSDDITLKGVINKYRALFMGEMMVKKARDNIQFVVPCGLQAIVVEVGDICDITYEPYGFVSKLARVVEKEIDVMTGDVKLTLKEHFDSFYDRDIPAEFPTAPDTGLEDPSAKLPAVANLAVSTGDSIFVSYDSPAISVTWDQSTDTFLNGYELEYITSSETVILPITNREVTEGLISPAKVGTTYTVNVYAMSTLGFRGFVSSLVIDAEGETTPTVPSSLVADSGDSQLLIQGNGNILTRVKLTWASDTPRVGFEIQHKLTSDAAYTNTPVASDPVNRNEYILGLTEAADYDIRIRALNKSAQSDWLEISHTVIGKTAAPPPLDGFGLQIGSDGTREFDGYYPDKPVDFAAYLIRFKSSTGAVWSEMADLTTDPIPALPYETNALSAGVYTFGIKAVDTTGNESDAIYLEQEIGNPRIGDVLKSVDVGADGYTGTKTDCSVQESGVLISDDDGTTTWTTHATWAAYTEFVSNPESPITYEHGAIDAGVVTTFVPAVSHPGSIGSITVTEAHSDDDITYTSFAAIGSPITARYVKVKIVITHTGICVLDNLSIRLESEEVSETQVNLDTSTLTVETGGGVRLPIDETYAVINFVNIMILGSAANVYVSLEDKDASLGPLAVFRNSSGTLQYPDVDYQIKGL